MRDSPTKAYMHLTAMTDHRGDGNPTQFLYPDEVRAAAEALYKPFPQWFETAMMQCLLNGGSLVLTAEQLHELAPAVLMPCGCEGPHHECYGVGYLPR